MTAVLLCSPKQHKTTASNDHREIVHKLTNIHLYKDIFEIQCDSDKSILI